MIGASGTDRKRARGDGGVSGQCLGLGIGAIIC